MANGCVYHHDKTISRLLVSVDIDGGESKVVQLLATVFGKPKMGWANCKGEGTLSAHLLLADQQIQ